MFIIYFNLILDRSYLLLEVIGIYTPIYYFIGGNKIMILRGDCFNHFIRGKIFNQLKIITLCDDYLTYLLNHKMRFLYVFYEYFL